MAITMQHTAPNFATGNYHRILKVELLCGPTETVPRYHVLLGFYASREARDANVQPMYVNTIDIPFDALVKDPREELYGIIMQCSLFSGQAAQLA